MTTPHTTPGRARLPARPVVSAAAVARLPRWPLWLLCAAYALPGFFGRDPWKGDGLPFGVMWQIAAGHSTWLQPSIYGHPVGGGWLPYWLGAASIDLFGPWLGAITSSRLPFIALLALALMQTWYAAYHFALRDAAQPVQPAFATPISVKGYARAIADGALLTLLACLGLLGRGHETLPELAQLAGYSALLLGLSLVPTKPRASALALGSGLLILASSGAPWLALFAALLIAALISSQREAAPRFAPALAVAGGLAFAMAILAVVHGSAVAQWPDFASIQHFFGTFAWFVWPAWPLAALAVWRWRESVGEWHVLAPLGLLLLACLAALLAARNVSTLVLALPAAAALAALALPVMRRGSLAALDWFSLLFFSLLALVIWVLWLAMLTGFPAKPAANIARLAPGFIAHFSWLPTLVALFATLSWAAVVAWRAGRHRHPLWKGMVLSAGGVTLVWVLVGTLWMPVLDYASTYRPLGRQLAAALRKHSGPEAEPAGACVTPVGLSLTQQALLGYWSHARFGPETHDQRCGFVLVLPPRANTRPAPADVQPQSRAEASAQRQAERGTRLWSGHRPGEPQERFSLYRRATTAP